jgi:hypothetical protein
VNTITKPEDIVLVVADDGSMYFYGRRKIFNLADIGSLSVMIDLFKYPNDTVVWSKLLETYNVTVVVIPKPASYFYSWFEFFQSKTGFFQWVRTDRYYLLVSVVEEYEIYQRWKQ